MSAIKKKLLLLVVISMLCFNAFSQLSISYYSSSLSKIGLGYDFNDRLWSELKIYSNTTWRDLTPELTLSYNFISKDFHQVYAGFGGTINYFTGFVLPVGVRFYPFEKTDRFSLHIELEPTLDIESDLIIQSAWGIRYMFKQE